MTANTGSLDRIVRLVIGLILIALAIIGVGTPWTWIGIVPAVTGMLGWCPAYRLLGINTCGTQKE
jgi:hypothetical protein